MDSSAVYALFEELKQKIEQLGNVGISDSQTNSNLDSQEIVVLMHELRNRVNQRQFSREQIKNCRIFWHRLRAILWGKSMIIFERY